MKLTVLGLGNVLMGDDGVGPTVIKHLEARYHIPLSVRVMEVGTPGHAMIELVADSDPLIVVDAIAAPHPPGTLLSLSREELLGRAPSVPVSPHEPGLKEALFTLEIIGGGPRDVVLLGVVPEDITTAEELSEPVAAAVDKLVALCVEEMTTRGVTLDPKDPPEQPDLWWKKSQN